jgi:hypothetical protein
MTEQERQKIAEAALLAALCRRLDPEFAAVKANAHAARVRMNDSAADAASVNAIADEIVSAANPNWRMTPASGDADPFYEKLRATMAARRAEQERQRQAASATWDRLAGGR